MAGLEERLKAMRHSPLGIWNRFSLAMVYSLRQAAPRKSSASSAPPESRKAQRASRVKRTW